MKLAKLFRKVEKYFKTEEKNQTQKKREKLLGSLLKKIDSMKEKIKTIENNSLKNAKKKELEVLQELKKKLQQEDEY